MTLHKGYLHLHSALLNEYDLMVPICLAWSFNSWGSPCYPQGADCRYSSVLPFGGMVWILSENNTKRARIILKETGAGDQRSISMDHSKEKKGESLHSTLISYDQLVTRHRL